ncbi:MAG: DUF302 domain-containing protein [Pseudomonadota bacterium]
MKNLIAICAISIGVAACAATATESNAMKTADATTMKKHNAPHVIAIESAANFETTLANLRAAIDKRGFKTFAVIDHAAGAASINETLRPTTLIIFGNPKGGTPLMQAEQKLGLELPLKMLVAENANGGVDIIYPDISHLFHEYGIADMATPLTKIERALGVIAAEAAQ